MRRLVHTLHVGDVVAVGVSVPVVGEYRSGGGWVFKGRKFHGRHGVVGELLQIESDRPDVLAAAVGPNGNLELTALSPGACTLALTATVSRSDADRPSHADVVTDAVVFTVEP